MSKINKNVEFQNEAIKKLKRRINFVLSEDEFDCFNFKSCVASGKTVMCARLMQDLLSDSNYKDYAFVWISTSQGNLCYQSKSTIEKIVDFQCFTLEQTLTQGIIQSKSCTFIPWELINKSTNKYRGQAEYPTFDSVLKDTTCPIILFVDESHDTLGTDNSKEIIDMINPQLYIKVSATPKDFEKSIDVEVAIESVIAEGFIKKIVEIQKDLIKKDDDSIDNILLSAVKKRDELEKCYKKHNIKYTPLCLIQIANDSHEDNIDAEEVKNNKEKIKSILLRSGIVEDDIGVWLSEEKTSNLKDINNNSVKYLIIKQAIAKGWDCPRSHILVRLRETKSVILDIQTMGRILRTIDKFKGHYNDDLIDSAYIYTNDPNFTLSDDNNIPVRINAYTTYIKPEFAKMAGDIEIPASHFKKSTPEIKGDNLIRAIKSKINDYFIAQNKKIDEDKITRLQLAENSIEVKETIWNTKDSKEALQTKKIPLKEGEIEKKYDKLIRKIYPSFGEMILETLDKIADECKIEQVEFYKYVLSNEDIYASQINAAIESIREANVYDYVYKIPSQVSVTNSKKDNKKYLYTESPQMSKKGKKESPEEKMEKYLENNNNVVFWFKNIERQPEAFCIAYDNTGKTEKNDNFYPDFFVLDKDKKLWILETKGAQDEDIDKKTPEKFIGIQNYMNANKKNILKQGKIKDICFSIVRPDGDTLKIFTGEDYKKDIFDSRWKKLII